MLIESSFLNLLHYRVHPFRAAQVQAIENGAAYRHNIRATCQRLEYVRATPYAAVKNNGHALVHHLGNARQHLEGCGRAI